MSALPSTGRDCRRSSRIRCAAEETRAGEHPERRLLAWRGFASPGNSNRTRSLGTTPPTDAPATPHTPHRLSATAARCHFELKLRPENCTRRPQY